MALAWIRAKLFSRTTGKALLNLGLVVGSALGLLAIATTATALFFTHFLPDQSLSWPVYLQYGIGFNPVGVAALTGRLPIAQQEYDISLTLVVPRSPSNAELGNFMVGLYLADQDLSKAINFKPRAHMDSLEAVDEGSITFSSRRPALVPYEDPMLSLASRALFLPYHLLRSGNPSWTITIPMAEHLSFYRASAVPRSVCVEVEAGQTIQIYSASVTMTAKLSGLQWLLYHYRLVAFVTLTTAFWAVELIFSSVALFGFTALSGHGEQSAAGATFRPKSTRGRIKDDPEFEQSDAGKRKQVSETKFKQEDSDDRAMDTIPQGSSTDTGPDPKKEDGSQTGPTTGADPLKDRPERASAKNIKAES